MYYLQRKLCEHRNMRFSAFLFCKGNCFIFVGTALGEIGDTTSVGRLRINVRGRLLVLLRPVVILPVVLSVTSILVAPSNLWTWNKTLRLSVQVKQLIKICRHLIAPPVHPRLLKQNKFEPFLRPGYFLIMLHDIMLGTSMLLAGVRVHEYWWHW